MQKLFYLFLVFGFLLFGQQNSTIRGIVTDSDGNPLSQCNIFIPDLNIGTTTGSSGFYKLKLKSGSFEIKFQFLGYETKIEKIYAYPGKIVQLNVSLKESALRQQTVTVTGKQKFKSISTQKLDVSQFENIPTLYSDVFRMVKILPGVTSNNELSTAYNVRGGSHDENLVYVNGYEVFRPQLLKQGVEENQGLINPELTETFKFYGGGFPVEYGNKMSSVLSVDYRSPESRFTRIKASLLNSSFSYGNKLGDLKFIAGIRYAYPSMFLKSLQTKGNYDPNYLDIQLLADYKLSNYFNYELFFLTAKNEFDLTPSDYTGNFRGVGRGDYREILIIYDGVKGYNYKTNLIGSKIKFHNDENFNLELKGSFTTTEENEKVNLSSNIYYNEFAIFDDLIDLETPIIQRKEFSDNKFELDKYHLELSGNYSINKLRFSGGVEFSSNKTLIVTDEMLEENGDSLVVLNPIKNQKELNRKFKQLAGYFQLKYEVSKSIEFIAGLRLSKFSGDEDYVNYSPRFSFNWYISPITTFKFSSGVFYQPPVFSEYQYNSSIGNQELKPQKSTHYISSLEHNISEKVFLQADAYYKEYDNLIPFYIDENRIIYNGANTNEAFSYGLDLNLTGEILNETYGSISYSYLNSKERSKNSNADYQRRLLDQTHTLQIFIQDRGRKSKNFQAHLRFLIGSGFLYHPRRISEIADGSEVLEIDYNNVEEFSRFMRADMGVTWQKKFNKRVKLKIVAEVLNVFNNRNALSYNFKHLVKGLQFPFKIPNLLSGRFFNIGATLEI